MRELVGRGMEMGDSKPKIETDSTPCRTMDKLEIITVTEESIKLASIIKETMQFDRDEKEYFDMPRTNEAGKFWMREWYKKCAEVDSIVNKILNNQKHKGR